MRTHFVSDMTFEEAKTAFEQGDTGFPTGAVAAHRRGPIGSDRFATRVQSLPPSGHDG